jgi:hypothetical protein
MSHKGQKALKDMTWHIPLYSHLGQWCNHLFHVGSTYYEMRMPTCNTHGRLYLRGVHVAIYSEN